MSEWLVPSAFLVVIINILVWVFTWGKLSGRVNTRLNGLEKNQRNPVVLPQCAAMFSDIKESLSNLNGKVEIILITMKEYQKDSERARTVKDDNK